MDVAVLGIGNELAADDGVGIHVVRQLQALFAEPRLHCLESERGGMDILDRLEGFDRAFIIDAACSGRHAPGTIAKSALRPVEPQGFHSSLHTLSVDAVLSLGSLAGFRLPDEVTLYTIEAADIETFGSGCTEAVRAAIPEVVSRVKADILSLCPDAVCVPPGGRIKDPLLSTAESNIEDSKQPRWSVSWQP